MSKINLTGYKLRNDQNTTKAVIMERLAKKGVIMERLRAGVSMLLELEPILIKASKGGLTLELPEPPEFIRWNGNKGRSESFRAYTKHDATELLLLAFKDYGLSAGLASRINSRDATAILWAFYR